MITFVSPDQSEELRGGIASYECQLEALADLEADLDRAFAHVVADNAQFEVQLTQYFESRSNGQPQQPQRPSSGIYRVCGVDFGYR